tara:strand:- start:3545 stop:3877 length:333 start_codon:yes stop_codon:yes gene_type:complete
MTDSKSPAECIEEALKTFKQRNESYGDNYLQHGRVMSALFPDGIKLKTVEDWNRFGIINMVVAKLTRYSQKWPEVDEGTIDSVHDMGVYSFMLESVDSFELEEKNKFRPF